MKFEAPPPSPRRGATATRQNQRGVETRGYNPSYNPKPHPDFLRETENGGFPALKFTLTLTLNPVLGVEVETRVGIVPDTPDIPRIRILKPPRLLFFDPFSVFPKSYILRWFPREAPLGIGIGNY